MRTTLAAVVAAIGVGAMTLGAAVEAAPASSPFAGQYTDPLPDAYITGDWGSISISSDGKILGTKAPEGFSDGRFTGSVQSDGTYEILGSWNPNKARWWVTDVLPVAGETSGAAGESDAGAAKALAGKVTYVQSSGTMALDGDGNIHGTTSYGNSFVWRHQ